MGVMDSKFHPFCCRHAWKSSCLRAWHSPSKRPCSGAKTVVTAVLASDRQLLDSRNPGRTA